MPSFTKRLHIDQYGDFDFAFTHVFARDREHYKVEVFNGKEKVCRFTMQPVLHYWMVADGYNLPIWVGFIELELENAIKQNQHSAVQ
jgi:hypothetical protein